MPFRMTLSFEIGNRDPEEFRRYIAGVLLRDCNDKLRKAAVYRLRWTADTEEMHRTIEEAEALEAEVQWVRGALSNAQFDYE